MVSAYTVQRSCNGHLRYKTIRLNSHRNIRKSASFQHDLFAQHAFRGVLQQRITSFARAENSRLGFSSRRPRPGAEPPPPPPPSRRSKYGNFVSLVCKFCLFSSRDDDQNQNRRLLSRQRHAAGPTKTVALPAPARQTDQPMQASSDRLCPWFVKKKTAISWMYSKLHT